MSYSDSIGPARVRVPWGEDPRELAPSHDMSGAAPPPAVLYKDRATPEHAGGERLGTGR